MDANKIKDVGVIGLNSSTQGQDQTKITVLFVADKKKKEDGLCILDPYFINEINEFTEEGQAYLPVESEKVAEPQLKIGLNVWAKWHVDGSYYKAVILDIKKKKCTTTSIIEHVKSKAKIPKKIKPAEEKENVTDEKKKENEKLLKKQKNLEKKQKQDSLLQEKLKDVENFLNLKQQQPTTTNLSHMPMPTTMPSPPHPLYGYYGPMPYSGNFSPNCYPPVQPAHVTQDGFVPQPAHNVTQPAHNALLPAHVSPQPQDMMSIALRSSMFADGGAENDSMFDLSAIQCDDQEEESNKECMQCNKYQQEIKYMKELLEAKESKQASSNKDGKVKLVPDGNIYVDISTFTTAKSMSSKGYAITYLLQRMFKHSTVRECSINGTELFPKKLNAMKVAAIKSFICIHFKEEKPSNAWMNGAISNCCAQARNKNKNNKIPKVHPEDDAE